MEPTKIGERDVDEVVEELSEQECWDLLRQEEFGRLIFRTAEGSKLLGVVMHQDVALEIDSFGEDQAWSVVARGQARVLEGEEARSVDILPPPS